MKSLTYFRINNIKFNYTLEFQNNYKNDYWKQNAPLIDYCETIGINIPHYCYHKSLSISGNCRMCLVELKNSPKPIVSCAMSAKSCLNNSEVFTNSPLVKKARENVLEFLLLNHPLDCPICDQGGECDLQDQSLFFGISKKRFYNFKRVVTDKNIGPIVKTVMTRCIHCTRCVRFAGEIAGTEDLGMFGRGLESEIGTYVTKTFQSELSGNIIDLCPVGALTSKPYAFVNRSWELKTVNAIDFSDGFSGDLQIYLKNNSVIKILPGYTDTLNNENWISDKTRFAFDGMFSPERVLEGIIKNFKDGTLISNTWKTLLNEITLTLYFQDHLNKHFYKTNSLCIIFDNNVSLEVLNLLVLFSKKYSFINLRKSENNLAENDQENLFLTNNQSVVSRQLKFSHLCLLVGINSRYESSQLNILLRKRYLKGDFKIFSFGSFTDLTIPTTSIGLTLKNVQSLVEGNSDICQELIHTKTTIVVGSSVFQRADSKGILKLLKILKLNTKNHGGSHLNILNLSINETGLKYLNNFDSLSVNDLNSSNGLYFLNSSSRALNLKKIINLKLLKYKPSTTDFLPKFCLEQNNGILDSLAGNFNSSYKTCNYINLPNSTFFESNATFLNTEGVIKKTIKLLSTNKQVKEDWQIIRKVFSCSKKIAYLNNTRDNSTINFNNNNLTKFRSFTNFLYVATSGITSKSNIFSSKTQNIYDIKFTNLLKFNKSKIYNTKLKIWINDFYIGGKDPYSKYSSTMIKCSRIFRKDQTTFAHIV